MSLDFRGEGGTGGCAWGPRGQPRPPRPPQAPSCGDWDGVGSALDIWAQGQRDRWNWGKGEEGEEGEEGGEAVRAESQVAVSC